MIEDAVIQKYLEEETVHFYRHLYRFRQKAVPVTRHNRGRGLSLHEYIKGLLFCLGKDQGYLPILEYRPLAEKGWRIDILWTNWDGQQLAAFEIDQTLYPKSVRKLKLLSYDCRKFIVSSGKGTKPVNLDLLAGTDIVRFDLTQTGLGLSDFF